MRRDRLVDLLMASVDARVVVAAAPAGYGKSTVLRQWSEGDPRPFLWLRCDASDADVVLFVRRDLLILANLYHVEIWDKLISLGWCPP